VALHDKTKIILQEPEPDDQPDVTPTLRQAQRRLTSAEQVQVAQHYRDGTQMRELAVQYGVHRTTISNCLKRLAIPLRNLGLQPGDIEEAARLYEQGWSLARLGEKFGCDHTDVHRKLIAYGVTMRRRPGWQY
jgi:lambda repressor-like predicted transcriptional regulator